MHQRLLGHPKSNLRKGRSLRGKKSHQCKRLWIGVLLAPVSMSTTLRLKVNLRSHPPRKAEASHPLTKGVKNMGSKRKPTLGSARSWKGRSGLAPHPGMAWQCVPTKHQGLGCFERCWVPGLPLQFLRVGQSPSNQETELEGMAGLGKANLHNREDWKLWKSTGLLLPQHQNRLWWHLGGHWWMQQMGCWNIPCGVQVGWEILGRDWYLQVLCPGCASFPWQKVSWNTWAALLLDKRKKMASHEAAQLPHTLYSPHWQVSWQKRYACSFFLRNATASWQKRWWL